MYRDVRIKRKSPVPLILGIVFGAIGFQVAVGILIVYITGGNDDPPRVEETPWQRQQNILDAFAGEPIKNDPALRRELQVFFDDLGRVWKAKNAKRLLDYFDLERMLDQEDMAADLPLRENWDKKRAAVTLAVNLEQQLVRERAWTDSDIKKIQLLPQENEVLVYVQHFNAETTTVIPRRWWLRHDGLRWRIYDDEYLQSGLRHSTQVGAVNRLIAQGKRPDWIDNRQR